ncbi:MAG: dual specificity protein phosphatase family protein [Sedimentisphaerales bacterium]|nr:dual specificity protein phosphatase family protein [Sedimentisphaerales bacterium]
MAAEDRGQRIEDRRQKKQDVRLEAGGDRPQAPPACSLRPAVFRRRTVGLSLTAVVLVVAVWTWEEVIEDRVIPKRWGVVEAGIICRSGQLSAALVKRTLIEHGIKVIVNLTAETNADKDQQAEREAAQELGIEVKRFPLRGDGTGDITQYAGAVEAVVEAKRAGKPVLVHCAAGSQRTGGTIAFYRLLVEGRSPAFVVEEMTRYDWDPKDDTILLEYINAHIGELAAMLKDRGVIEEIPDPLPVLSTSRAPNP